MSRFSGKQGRGAMRHLKELKHEEAEARNKVYRDNIEFQEKMADPEALRESSLQELIAESE